MKRLSDEQLNNLSKDALVILFSSKRNQVVATQEQLASVREKFNQANSLIAVNNKQIELFVEQIRIMK